MPKVPFTAFFNGPLAVYPSPTGQTDPVTGAIQLGTDFLEGNYADVSNEDANNWNSQYSTQLKGGRYRICRLAQNAVAASLPQVTGRGGVVGWAAGTFVQGVVISAAGTGYANGTYSVASTYNIGSQSPAVAQVTISGGAIISAQLIQGGGPFLTFPTFSLSELSGGSGAALQAQLYQSSSYVSSFDSTDADATHIGLIRGITYAAPTAAQITAGAWIVVQESGIAQVEIGTASAPTPGLQVIAVNANAAGAANAQSFLATSIPLEVGYTLAAPYAATTCPVKLTIPVIED